MRGHGTLPSRQAPGTQKLRIRWSPGVASRGLTEHRLGGDAHEVEAPLKALRAGRARGCSVELRPPTTRTRGSGNREAPGEGGPVIDAPRVPLWHLRVVLSLQL